MKGVGKRGKGEREKRRRMEQYKFQLKCHLERNIDTNI